MIDTESSFLFPLMLQFQGYLNRWASVNKIHIFFTLQYFFINCSLLYFFLFLLASSLSIGLSKQLKILYTHTHTTFWLRISKLPGAAENALLKCMVLFLFWRLQWRQRAARCFSHRVAHRKAAAGWAVHRALKPQASEQGTDAKTSLLHNSLEVLGKVIELLRVKEWENQPRMSFEVSNPLKATKR